MNRRLSAFSVLETLVASVIFLIIFMIAMRALADLTGYRTACLDPAIIEVEMERCRQNYIRNCSIGNEVEYECGWGKIVISVEPNYEYDGVMLLNVTAVPYKGMTLEYRCLCEY